MPLVFISWAKELHIDLPSELLSELEKVGNTAIDWRKQWIKLKSSHDLLIQEKPSSNSSTLKTENLLKAIASIAIDAYGYDPSSAKSIAPKDISNALKKHGMSLDPKTIKNWLKEGLALLPRKPT